MGKRKKKQPTGKPKDIRIANKVRFWQEQDRINQELIPRVIRHEEWLEQLTAEHADFPSTIARSVSKATAAHSSRISELEESLRSQSQIIQELESRIGDRKWSRLTIPISITALLVAVMALLN